MNKNDGTNWKAFTIGDLFVKEDLKWKAKRKFDKSKDVSKTISKEYNLPLVNAKNGDNGIMYYGRMEDWEVEDMCLDIVNDGAVSTGNVYAQPQRTGVLYNAYLVKPLYKGISQEILLFLACCLEKSIKHKYSYENKATWEKVQSDTIYLPANGDIPDWNYMSERVRELEEERVRELDAYLKATGLDDFELTDEEKKLIEAASKNNRIKWGEFRVRDLFEPLKVGFIGNGQKIGSATKKTDTEHCIPLTCAKIGDNGIMYWGKKGDFITYTNALSVIADGAVSAGLVYAQPEEAGAYSHSYFIRVKDTDVSKYTNMYLSAILTKVIYPKYSREDAPRWNKIEHEVISLPITSTGTPDWDFMEKYIRATEKLVIADVVKWKDKQIELTKKVVNQEVS